MPKTAFLLAETSLRSLLTLAQRKFSFLLFIFCKFVQLPSNLGPKLGPFRSLLKQNVVEWSP